MIIKIKSPNANSFITFCALSIAKGMDYKMNDFIEIQLDDNTKIYIETTNNNVEKRSNSSFIPASTNGRETKKKRTFWIVLLAK